MCGIAGFWAANTFHGDAGAALSAMAGSISTRGPDAEGQLWDAKVGLGLAHRRLAIQDLSPAGAQPMSSQSGRYVIAFNGEIYNFRSLAARLAACGHHFVGHSDTEVMLAAFEQWGVETALHEFAGMFAFALWDRQENSLWLARDRMGEKPLYYGWHRGVLLFASELKALKAFPGFSPAINPDALTLLLQHNYIPAPHTIYQGIEKLLPAHCVCIKFGNATSSRRPVRYWSLADTFRVGESWKDIDDAEEALDRRLEEVIKEQMVADVPLGAFLSGGIDSSTVVAVMQKHSSRPVRTFTIGFDVPGYNEAEHAAAIARHLGTQHTELYVTANDALDVVQQLPVIYDEPFADSSQIPTSLVCKMTRESVTVALSGDGGDELFAGYNHYPVTIEGWRRLQTRKEWKKGLTRALLSLPDAVAGSLVWALCPTQRRLSPNGVREKLLFQHELSSAVDLQSYFLNRNRYWAAVEGLVPGAVVPRYALNQEFPSPVASLSELKQLQWLDLNCYLPDDILAKVDRAAMAVSLETRIPFLDHRIVSFALALPEHFLCRNGVGKTVLRRVLQRYVPSELVNRPKQGFAVPVSQWLRKELREWAEALLDARQMRQHGYWDVDRIRHVWSDHLQGKDDYGFQLWGVLMFQAWLQSQKN